MAARLSPTYRAYIGSETWLSSPARLEELALSGHRCRICNEGGPQARLQVHHRTYANFTRESAHDLTTLCSDCHGGVTADLRRRRAARAKSPEGAIRRGDGRCRTGEQGAQACDGTLP